MIKNLRKRFILIAMTAFALVVILIIGAVNIIHFNSFNTKENQKMKLLELNKGVLPNGAESVLNLRGSGSVYYQTDSDDEFIYEIRYFTVTLDYKGGVQNINMTHTATLKQKDAVSYAEQLYKQNKDNGYVHCYKYKKIYESSQIMYIFLNCHSGLSECRNFFAYSIAIGIIGLILVFILVTLFSAKAVRPIAESYAKQKQFITDASHELKTPMAIICADTEVLEMTSGENEWTRSIRRQIERLTNLTHQLIFLSKMDEENTEIAIKKFCLSELAEQVVQSFEPAAKSKGKTIESKIETNIIYNGDEMLIRRLITILFDNAVKYSPDGSIISFSLKGKRHIIITVQNKTEGMKKGRQDKLFERFYREEKSRSSDTGGFGIGLSSAKAIVQAHGGKITAFCPEDNLICFTVHI